MEVSEKTKSEFIENSFERYIAKNFPEYSKFFTENVDYRDFIIVNSSNKKTQILEELKQGKLGDVIDLYLKLKQE